MVKAEYVGDKWVLAGAAPGHPWVHLASHVLIGDAKRMAEGILVTPKWSA